MPEDETPDKIDWTRWWPAQEDDVRSPCPFLNVLANHGVLPHDGRNISKDMLTGVLKRSDIANFSPDLASMLANGALKANPAPHATTIDLGQLNVHNVIEHDASLSRNDAALGDNSDFSPERWKEMLQIYADADGDMVTYKEASKAKATRVRLSKEQHEAIGAHIGYGLREVFLSYGETALLLKTLGKSGKVPLRHLRIFFEEQRMPHIEGWVPPEEVVTKRALIGTMVGTMAANPSKTSEILLVIRGTSRAVKTSIVGLFGRCCGRRKSR